MLEIPEGNISRTNLHKERFLQWIFPERDPCKKSSGLKQKLFCVTEHTQVFEHVSNLSRRNHFKYDLSNIYIYTFHSAFTLSMFQFLQLFPSKKRHKKPCPASVQSHQTATHQLSTCCWCRVQVNNVTAPPEGERCLGGSTSQKRWQMNVHSLFQDPHISQKNQVKSLLVTLTGRGSHPVPIYVYTYIPSLKLTVRT